MAVNVDIVYKTVLLILNKEQRGYITPDEFNKIGSQVQREIFEAYFEDLNQQVRIQQTDMEYSDRVAITDEKIAEFKVYNPATHTTGGIFTLPSDLYRLGSLTYTDVNSLPVEVQRVGRAEFYNIRKSPLTKPTEKYPIYLYEDNKVLVYPNTINADLEVQYVKKPEDIRWGYTIGDVGQYVFSEYDYDPTSVNIGDLTSSITSNNTTQITDGTYTRTISGAGFSGLELTITVSGNTITEIEVTQPGTGFTDGQTITLLGNSFPGTAPGGVGAGICVITLNSSNFFSASQQGHIDFGLHNSERTEVILKILLYQGVVIRDPQIIQVAAQKVQQEEVNEKS
jgi:hypothetical protein